MPATGYLFFLRRRPGGRNRSHGRREQGFVVEIGGKPGTWPLEPWTRRELVNSRSDKERRTWALLFVRGMTLADYQKYRMRLKRRRCPKDGLLAVMPDEPGREKLRRTFQDRTQRPADIPTITFAELKALLRHNNRDEPVDLEAESSLELEGTG